MTVLKSDSIANVEQAKEMGLLAEEFEKLNLF